MINCVSNLTSLQYKQSDKNINKTKIHPAFGMTLIKNAYTLEVIEKASHWKESSDLLQLATRVIKGEFVKIVEDKICIVYKSTNGDLVRRNIKENSISTLFEGSRNRHEITKDEMNNTSGLLFDFIVENFPK